MITPLISLMIFFLLTTVGYFIFKPNTGYYWKIRKAIKLNEKILKEDALKVLYHAESKFDEVTKSELEDLLEMTDSETEETISSLQKSKLIIIESEIVTLTKEGRDYALKIIRAHRLYEKYLSEKTGYNKLDWHDMAEEMEHKLSYAEIEELSSKLGSPHFDPHGDPIPTKAGDMIEERGIPLYDLPENSFGRIVHIEDEPDVVYKQILAENLHIGSQVRIIESNKLRVKFYCEGEEYILANEVAANLAVIELSKEERNETDVFRLSALKNDESAVVEGISKECRGANRRRLLDLGFVPGTKVSIGLVSPMNDPRAYRLRSTDIALRNEQANFILIKLDN